MKGGSNKFIPMYQEPTLPSTTSNEQKQIFAEKQAERQQKPPQQPTIQLQYYQPPPPPKPKQDTTFMPIYGQQPYQIPPPYMYNYPFMPAMGNPSSTTLPPIVKNVYVNAYGPAVEHDKIYQVYEDSLPSKSFVNSLSTVNERIVLMQFIRSSIFNNTDGDNIALKGDDSNSLLSFIKFGELNPYNTQKISANPYKGLPNGFLLYKSCYPIRLDDTKNTITCAKDSTAVNIRIYKMTEGSYETIKKNKANCDAYDELREIIFYEYLREYIIKKNVCPNFGLLYGYFISEKAGIDYEKIDKIRNKIVTKKDEPAYKPIVEDGRTIYEKNPDAYLGKSLVLMTESSNYNVYTWASKIYNVKGNVREMINRGSHTDKEWMNLFFQLMAALYAMQLHGIFIANFSLENNVYVKDLSMKGTTSTYWKYKINGVEYFIPNMGFMVIVDSNYKDLEMSTELTIKSGVKRTHKLDGKIYSTYESSNLTNDNKEMLMNLFGKTIFSSSADGSSFTGSKPGADIMKMLEDIREEIESSIGIDDCILKHMRMFMNNRIGTYLKDVEISNIRKDDTREFTKGQIVVYEEGYNTYKFVMYISFDATPERKIKILTKNEDMNEIIETNVPSSSLFNYSKTEPIAQNFKSGEPTFNEEDLLETYILRS